ncbi:MAG: acyl-ACP--UDP-N-acetylglucosamine O-acyltransferase [Desulfovibrionaceae bacterium]|jgi:UDP-N-acetylglucosamine acyltransferase|nr:acyl-ACP--UDP-N-acetylglucosamine O-acyltransferase [Desulfovibrionaceae bacterium]
MPSQIHPTAIVDPGAQLGEDVVVGPYAIIEDKTVIGDRCRIDPFAKILPYTFMGSDNHVHSNALVGGAPQDLKFHGEESTLEIGNGNTIREFATVHRGTEGGGGVTRVGNGCLLMAYTHTAHDCILGDGVIMSNAASLAGHVIVGDQAIIGGMSGVHQFVRIGEHAFVGAMSGLAQDLPPFMLASGNRAQMHGPNSVGLRRMRASQIEIRALRTAYKRLFRSDLSIAEAIEEVEYELGDHETVKTLVRFLRVKSNRGVTSAALKTENIED